ncbi:FG-GAP repeat domain-containing protein [Luteimonas salinilitoris]|uniref:FG-GAP repeat domain-containing protein n=1 Tax=Luteimonas salinilitoris TaxID=3237697 RepID=A0ABV4HLH6_9GAMM
MIKTFFIAIALSGCQTVSALSDCAIDNLQQAAPPIYDGNKAICFMLKPLTDESGRNPSNEEPQVSIYIYNQNGEHENLDDLPYLAGTGKVRGSFFLDANNDGNSDIFVIHSIEIRSDTGENYVSDYYTVSVYTENGGKYERNEKISKWFGTGGDIAEPIDQTNKDYNIIYEFPYKTKESIESSINSPIYQNWLSGRQLSGTIREKASLHSFPVVADKTRSYLIAEDRVIIKSETAGWCEIQYLSESNELINMWTECTKIHFDQ